MGGCALSYPAALAASEIQSYTVLLESSYKVLLLQLVLLLVEDGAPPAVVYGTWCGLQEWTLKANSCSECMLLRVRRSGSLSRSRVNTAVSLGAWFFVMRLRNARISVSCSAATEFTFSMP